MISKNTILERLNGELESYVEVNDPNSLAQKIKKIEEYFISLTGDIIIEFAFNSESKDKTFIHKTNFYVLQFHVGIRDTHTAYLSIYNRESYKSNLIEELVEVDHTSYGQIKYIELAIDKKLIGKKEDILRVLNICSNAFYTRLKHLVEEGIRALKSKLADSLYSYTKFIFSGYDSTQLTKDFLYAVIDAKKNKGRYIPDDSNAKDYLERIEKNRGSLFKSTAELAFAKFYTQQDFEEMFALNAIKQGVPKNVDISDAKYSGTKNTLLLAEIAIMNSYHFTVYPVVREGNKFLVAWYPSKNSKKINKILDENKEKISEIYLQNGEEVKKIFEEGKEYLGSKMVSYLAEKVIRKAIWEAIEHAAYFIIKSN